MNLELFLATKTGTPIIGQIASVMGWIMDGIYKMLDGLFGIQNILHLRFYKICNLPLFCPPCLQNYFIYILILSYFLEFFNTVLVDI